MSSEQGQILNALLGCMEAGDSDDFSPSEAKGAISTSDAKDFTRNLLGQVRGTRVAKFTLKKYAIRRFENHLYIRVHLTATREPDKVVVYQADWVNA